MTDQFVLREAAQANADYFGVAYVCFLDTSGNYRVERYDDKLACHRTGTIFYPKGDNHGA